MKDRTSTNLIIKWGGVGSIAWLGIRLDSKWMCSVLLLRTKYGLVAEGLKVDSAGQAIGLGRGIFDELAD